MKDEFQARVCRDALFSVRGVSLARVFVFVPFQVASLAVDLAPSVASGILSPDHVKL